MRIPAAIVLCISGAASCFVSVSILLDEAGNIDPGSLGQSRLGAFSAAPLAATSRPSTGPGYRSASAPEMPHRPFPTFVAAGKLDPAIISAAARPAKVRAAHVPPIVRRRPEAAPAAPAPSASTDIAAAERSPLPTQARPRPGARPPFDTATRSALGGPRQP